MSDGGYYGVALKSLNSFRFKVEVDSKLVYSCTSPVSSVAARAHDQYYRAARIPPPSGRYNFVDDAEADEAVDYETLELLKSGSVQYCTGVNCGGLIKKVKKAGATCQECKEPRVEKMVNTRFKPATGHWEATVWLGQRRNKYVGAFSTEEEAADTADCFIRSYRLDTTKLNYATPAAGAAAAAAARAAYDEAQAAQVAEAAKAAKAAKAPKAKRAKKTPTVAAAAAAGAGSDDEDDE